MSLAQRCRASDIDRVAVIGAGPSGLAAAKYLLAEKTFSTVDVFEQHSTVGGVWAYTPHAEDRGWWVSPVYDLLETNITHTLMKYTDLDFPADSALFPRHEVVKRYLDAYAEPLGKLVHLSTQVVSVQKVARAGRDVWEVQTCRSGSDALSTAYYDAVVIANGHYSEAFTPCIPGLDAFIKAHPGRVSHSKQYRRPGQFAGKKVVVVGNSASGADISAQISTTAKLPILISEKDRRSEPAPAAPCWAKPMPQIVEFIPDRRCVRFANGEIETDIDAVVFCTGYVYSFPFLKGLGSAAVVSDGGACVHGLYQHVFSIDDPTLAFLGIPQRVVPFPFAEGQAAWISRVWAGRLGLPPTSEMRAWETALLLAKGSAAALHSMGPLQDVDYINDMHRLSLEADRDAALENGGVGKMPPFWGDEKRWLRAQMPLAKAASRKLGGERHKLRDLAALGFVYPEQSTGSPQAEHVLVK
ncbi:Thiol-specific monooxygenase [Cordyceps militaris]|uniref:Thiol-specific monooxygenase n=1 Tax=Cordyceps militaris TaxID=73501 RepID=A0A2H4SA32_CORMI|nr:Thiol-specific monooxygenase [Cordyceps militaris]